MFQQRFILEKYNGAASRYECPKCGKRKQFTRYIDTNTMQYVGKHVGICNRKNNCNYHYTPKQYFIDNQGLINVSLSRKQKSILILIPKINAKLPSFIEPEVLKNSLTSFSINNFVNYLWSLFGKQITSELVRTYLIGTSNHWKGANIFWLIDYYGRIRTGKVMLYNQESGRRVKEPFPHVCWVHKISNIQNFNLGQCFFGEHLLKQFSDRPVAIVESEKTAIIASVYLPQFIWLSCGCLTGLNIQKCKVLSGKKVYLFPDMNGYEKWNAKAKEILKEVNCNIRVSNHLEINATEIEKQNGNDIADYLIVRDSMYGWALSDHNYPFFWDFQ